MLPKSILVPTDLSEGAEEALNYACEIAQKFAYVRGTSALSSGRMVKLICLRSFMGPLYPIGGRNRPL